MTTIRWAVMGTGVIAKQFAHGLQSLPDAQLLAVGSRTLNTANDFAKQFQIPRAYGSYEELVQDQDIDVVYIATPHIKHMENCLLCLNAGKAVLCEKPFTLNAQEAREVIKVARQKQLFCMEAMWMRFVPLMVKLQEIIQSGEIGDICMINASLGFLNEYDPHHRAFNPDLGGGALLDLGVYPLSFAFQLLGKPSSIVSQAEMASTGVDAQAAIVLSYESGALATLSTSFRAFQANDAVITGTKGRIHIQEPLYRPESLSIVKYPTNFAESRLSKTPLARLKHVEILRKSYRRLQRARSLLRRDNGQITISSAGNGYQYEAAEVMRCLRANACESNVMPLDETLEIMTVMDTIRQQWNLQYPQERYYEQECQSLQVAVG